MGYHFLILSDIWTSDNIHISENLILTPIHPFPSSISLLLTFSCSISFIHRRIHRSNSHKFLSSPHSLLFAFASCFHALPWILLSFSFPVFLPLGTSTKAEPDVHFHSPILSQCNLPLFQGCSLICQVFTLCCLVEMATRGVPAPFSIDRSIILSALPIPTERPLPPKTNHNPPPSPFDRTILIFAGSH